MSIVTIPRAGMPLDNAGNKISAEWYRFLHNLAERAGGTSAPTNNELSMLINNAGAGFMLPGDDSDEPFLIVGPPGPAGSSTSGSGNSVTVACDFGASFGDKAQTVVTGQTWVAADTEIVAQVLTPAGVDPDEMYLLDLRPVISDLVVGDGFTVTLYSEPEATGSYSVMCIGV